jgi:predicted transposase/invertase (TIGR01784 family)
MLGLDELKQTRVYQDGLSEGRAEGRAEGQEIGERRAKEQVIPAMIQAGLTIKQVAKIVDLSVAEVQKIFNERQKPG